MAVFAIAFIAVFFLAMGLYALAAPTALAQPLGITLTSSTSRSEVRAVYGGFGVAMAGILGFAAVNPEYRTGITLTAAAARGIVKSCGSVSFRRPPFRRVGPRSVLLAG